MFRYKNSYDRNILASLFFRNLKIFRKTLLQNRYFKMKIVSNYAYSKNNNPKTHSQSFGTLNVSDVFRSVGNNKKIEKNVMSVIGKGESDTKNILKRLKVGILDLSKKFSNDGLQELKLKSLVFSNDKMVEAQVEFPEEFKGLAEKLGYGKEISASKNIQRTINLPFHSYEAVESAYLNAQIKLKQLHRINNLLEKNLLMKESINSADYLEKFTFLEQYHPKNAQILESFLNGCNYAMGQIAKNSGVKITSVSVARVEHPHLLGEFYKGTYRIKAVAQIEGDAAKIAQEANISSQIIEKSPKMNAYNGNGEIVGAIENNAIDTIMQAYDAAIKRKKKLDKLGGQAL